MVADARPRAPDRVSSQDQAPGKLFVIGDVHGQLDALIVLLRMAGLLDRHLFWSGGTDSLWFMGDFFDRGPDGIETVDLVMRLQMEAAQAGGSVGALIGNHEVLLLGAYYFPEVRIGPELTFKEQWEANLGQESDLVRLSPLHIEWLSALPAMVYARENLLVHADSFLYEEYGASLGEVNAAFRRLLSRPEPEPFDRLLEQFTDRFAFADSRPDGVANALRFLEIYGGRRIIHGHTPIAKMTHEAPDSVRRPLVYAGGLCVDVDAGIYLGAPGFVYEVPELP